MDKVSTTSRADENVEDPRRIDTTQEEKEENSPSETTRSSSKRLKRPETDLSPLPIVSRNESSLESDHRHSDSDNYISASNAYPSSKDEVKISTPRVLPRGDLGSAGHGSIASGIASSPSVDSQFSAGRLRGNNSVRQDTPHFVQPTDSNYSRLDSSFQAEDGVSESVIFGTNINLQESMKIFRGFFIGFRTSETEEPFYLQQLHAINETQRFCISIDCRHIYYFEPNGEKLYKQLIHYPQEIIPIMDLVVHEEYVKLYGDQFLSQTGQRIQVRTFNLDKVKRMRDIDPSNIDQLIALHGMIIRSSGVIPDLKCAFYKCAFCNKAKDVMLDRGIIDEPTICEACSKKNCMQLIHNRSIFADKQYIKLQESPENIPQGETPHTVTLYTYDDLVDCVKPGDRVEVTGILRARAIRVNPRQRVVRSVYKTYVDVLHFRKTRKGGTICEKDSSMAFGSSRYNNFATEESKHHENNEGLELKYKEMAGDPEIYEKLAHSIAPSIWKLDDVKKGVLCLLFGGTNKDTGDPSNTRSLHRMRARGEINILLCGDPGTSKSQLLGYVHKLAPRGIYTSGKGSSAAGLTAYISKDPETKELVLESGALVLSDRGICCIDEFDKMSDSTRAILHECMEQQTISIAKAGIIATLNARTSILASANPIESKYNPRLSVVQNIQLPPTLLSRFDLIYLILDKPDINSDRRLAKHLVQLYFRNREGNSALYSAKTVSDYIAYAKQVCHPVLSGSAVRRLIEGYVDMRQLGALGGGKRTITATPRQLESLIRLSEARARIRLSNTVTEDDVAEALRLMHVATQRAALDPRTGTIDMDAINTGMGTADRQANIDLANEVLKLLKERYSNSNIKIYDISRDMNEQSSVPLSQEEIMRAIRLLKDDGKIYWSAHSGSVSLI